MNVQLEIDPATIEKLKSIIGETVEKVVKKLLLETRVPNEPIKTDDQLLTRDEVMKMLKISHSTLYHYQREGIIPFLKIGNRVYFKKKDILENDELKGCFIDYKKWQNDED